MNGQRRRTPTADATKRSERYGAKILQANSLRPAHPKPPNLETARESPPPGKIAIQKRQSIFDSGLARGRPAEAAFHTEFTCLGGAFERLAVAFKLTLTPRGGDSGLRAGSDTLRFCPN